MLVRKLSKHGKSLALVIDKCILDLLGIDEDTPLVLSTDGTRLQIAPTTADQLERHRRFSEVLEDTNRQYGEALQALADS